MKSAAITLKWKLDAVYIMVARGRYWFNNSIPAFCFYTRGRSFSICILFCVKNFKFQGTVSKVQCKTHIRLKLSGTPTNS